MPMVLMLGDDGVGPGARACLRNFLLDHAVFLHFVSLVSILGPIVNIGSDVDRGGGALWNCFRAIANGRCRCGVKGTPGRTRKELNH